MADMLMVNQIATLNVEAHTATGALGRLPGGRATWTATPPNVVTLTPSVDTLTCQVLGVTVAELCTVTVTCPGLPDASFDFMIVSGAVTHMVIVVLRT